MCRRTNEGGGDPPPYFEGSATPFDPALVAAAVAAIDISSCRSQDGPQGAGHIRLTFNADGTVLSAIIDDARFATTTVGSCIARKFLSLRVPELAGHPVIVGKAFSL